MNARLEICVDCVLSSANGIDDRYSETSEEHRARYREAMLRYGAEPDHLSGPEGDLEETAFSRASCDFCGDLLAGARYGAVLHQRKEQP